MAFDVIDLPSRLKRCRMVLGKSQKEMSEALKLGEASWQRYENGINKPGYDVLDGLIELGISPDWLFLGAEPVLLSERSDKASNLMDASNSMPTDRELMGRCIDAINKLYQDLNMKIPMVDMGREAADLHDEVAASGATGLEEQLGAIRFAIAQRRRAILTAPPSSKQQGSA